MKKLSKVLSVVLAVAMLCSMSFAVSAATYTDVSTSDSYYEAVEALSALGVVKGYEAGDFQPEGKITRAEAATMILRVMDMAAAESNRTNTMFSDVTSEHWASGTIAEATAAGVLNGMGDGTFAPEAEVTYEQIVKMLVCAMGYQKKAEAAVATGVNPFPTGYNIVANQKRITEGTTKTEGGATRATVARLIYNALTVNLMDQTTFGTDEYFGEIATQSLLYTKLDAIKVEAKIKDIELDPTNDKITIAMTKVDDVAYENGWRTTSFAKVKVGDVDLSGLQGLSVTALVDISESSDPVLLAVFPKAGKNEELVVDPLLFEGTDTTGAKIGYKKDAETSTVTWTKIDEDFTVYVNLVKVADVNTAAAAKAAIDVYHLVAGSKVTTNMNELKFVDTDNNGSYDSLFIDESFSFVVGRTDADEQGIYKSTKTGVNNSSATSVVAGTTWLFAPLDLDTENEDVSYFISDADGKELAFEDIKEGDILTVRPSKDSSNNYYYDIVVSSASSVEGTITEVSTETIEGKTASTANVTYYTIDGQKYRVNGAANSSKLSAGTSGVFKLTADGSIISFDLEASAKTYGVVVALANNNSSFSNGMEAQVITADGSVKTYAFASKLKINTAADIDTADYRVKAATNDTIEKIADNSVNTTIAQGSVVIFETNKDNEIRKIYTTTAGMHEVDEDLTLDTITSEKYNATTSRIKSRTITDNTVIIGNKGALTDVDRYSVASADALDETTSYNAQMVYNKSKEVEFILITNLMVKPAYDSEAMVITGVSTTSVDGEKRNKITGLVGNKEVSYVVAAEDACDVYTLGNNTPASYAIDSSLEAGEAIQFVLNANDEIIAVRELVAKINGKYATIALTIANVGDETDDEERKADAQVIDLATGTAFGAGAPTINEFYGYAAAGKVNTITNGSIEFFKTTTTGISNADDLTADSNLYTVGYAGTAFVFGRGYNKAKATAVESVKTFQLLGGDDVAFSKVNSINTADKSTCEDIVYTYSYDGTTVLNYVYDVLGNN